MPNPHAHIAEGDDWISIEDAADLCRVSTNRIGTGPLAAS